MAEEPVAGQGGGGFEGARLLEQVGRAGHDGEVALAVQHPYRIPPYKRGVTGSNPVAPTKVIRGVRRWSRVPILVLAGRSADRVRVEVLDAGADVLVTKPFEIDELMARVAAICRRTGPSSDVARVSLGELTVDLARQVVTARHGEIPLTATEWKLLEVLVRNMGRLMTKAQLLTEVWGSDHVKEGHYLRVYVNHLRRKLEADPARLRHLVTEPGLGYRLSP